MLKVPKVDFKVICDLRIKSDYYGSCRMKHSYNLSIKTLEQDTAVLWRPIRHTAASSDQIRTFLTEDRRMCY